MMINELTVKGRSDVRYIVTKSTICGNAVRIEEAAAVYTSGLRLFVSARKGSDLCLKAVIDALTAIRAKGIELHACILTDELFADNIRRQLVPAKLGDLSVVCSDEAAGVSRHHSSFVLTVPDSDEGGFFTLARADAPKKGTLVIGCDAEELEKALTAVSGAERKGADQ